MLMRDYASWINVGHQSAAMERLMHIAYSSPKV
jgi:hypothetical protein